MGRRKKNMQEKAFIPSIYQKNIFDFIEKGNGNLVVEAVAGSGKSSTIIKALDLIPKDKKILFCAFNNDIVKELKKKVGKQDNIDIRTVHSLGYLFVMRNLDKKSDKPNDTKYYSHIYNNVSNYTDINPYGLGNNKFVKYISNINKLVEHGRNNLSQSNTDLMGLVYRHNIDLVYDEVEVALKVMKWGKDNTETIDYTDMVWLPNALYMKPIGLQYDYIFVDEAQDLSVAQRELLDKCCKINTRYFYFGDSKQAIYSFASASPESFKTLRSRPNTISLPLSISYRCDKNIVRFAQTLVNQIESQEDALDGNVSYNASLDEIHDGDMVLCRNNAPLMKIYNDLIKLGKKTFIKGKDIGHNLKKMVSETNEPLLSQSLNKNGVFPKLYEDLFATRNALMDREKIDYHSAMSSSIITHKLDMINSLEVLSDGLSTAKELEEKIDEIFADKSDGISLSTIHKAKGLESDNVFIACQSLMPAKSAKQDWEKEQELNLMYVAYTRAKHNLKFLSETNFDNALIFRQSDKLKEKEAKINFLFGHKYSPIASDSAYTKVIIEESKKLNEKTKYNTNHHILLGHDDKPKTMTKYGLNSMVKRKIKRIKI